MARNTLAGKSTGKSKSAKYYASNPAARKKKLKYDLEFQKKASAVNNRVESNRANRKAGTYGNKDKKDASHGKSGKVTGMEPRSKNRARNGAKKGRPKSARRKNTKK
jgi:hypothetical protein